MCKLLRLTLRRVGLVATLATFSVLMSSGSAGNSPYVSALSNLSGSPALAASHCPDKACSVGGPCFRLAGSFCAKSGGQCFSRGCQ